MVCPTAFVESLHSCSTRDTRDTRALQILTEVIYKVKRNLRIYSLHHKPVLIQQHLQLKNTHTQLFLTSYPELDPHQHNMAQHLIQLYESASPCEAEAFHTFKRWTQRQKGRHPQWGT